MLQPGGALGVPGACDTMASILHHTERSDGWLLVSSQDRVRAKPTRTGPTANTTGDQGRKRKEAFGVWRLVRAAAGGGRPRWCVSFFVVAIRRSYDVKCAEEVGCLLDFVIASNNSRFAVILSVRKYL